MPNSSIFFHHKDYLSQPWDICYALLRKLIDKFNFNINQKKKKLSRNINGRINIPSKLISICWSQMMQWFYPELTIIFPNIRENIFQ
jgi:hypothetical protein